ncbi:unnamed protein product [Rodentolepis nana]|uniref:EF-hand domain-containing protein n=1 Tax=Rodentolepis nana TaxID=102285 RepID=A0A0R3TDI6_RODNA|nr:unnamed protein product [Rodentolepis nana]
MDLDRSGKITLPEFKFNVKRHGSVQPSERAIREYFEKMDKNRDGKLSFNEIKTAFADNVGMSVSAKSSKKKETPQGPSVQEMALQTFKAMDLDKSGKVSFIEFQKNMEKKVGSAMSSAALRGFFDSFDVNKDGELSLEELTKLMETSPM